MVNRFFFWASVSDPDLELPDPNLNSLQFSLPTGFGSRQVRYFLDLSGSGSGWARHFSTYRIGIWTCPPIQYLSDPDLDGPAISVPIGSGSGRARHFCTYRIRIWTACYFLTSGSGPSWWDPTIWCPQGPDPDRPVNSCPYLNSLLF